MRNPTDRAFKNSCVALVVAVIALVGRGAEASAILFTDRTAFNAAVGDVTLFTSFAEKSCESFPVPGWRLHR